MPLIPPPKVIPANPFTDEDLTNLDAHLKNIATGLVHVGLAQQAGIDVTKPKQDLEDARARLLRLRNVYFPNR